MKTEVIRNSLIVLLSGFVYYLIVKCTHFSIPCVFHLITGFKCPGCGITTMIMAFGRLDFLEAFWANPFLFCSIPLLVVEFIYAMVRGRKGLDLARWNKILVWIYAVALVVFGVIRNL